MDRKAAFRMTKEAKKGGAKVWQRRGPPVTHSRVTKAV